jgi:hypothetical protein
VSYLLDFRDLPVADELGRRQGSVGDDGNDVCVELLHGCHHADHRRVLWIDSEMRGKCWKNHAENIKKWKWRESHEGNLDFDPAVQAREKDIFLWAVLVRLEASHVCELKFILDLRI